MSPGAERSRRLRNREDFERRHIARMRARARARNWARRLAKAAFIIDTAAAEGVDIAIFGPPCGPSVSTWAPRAVSPERQRDCQESFKAAVEDNLSMIALLAAEPEGRA